MADVTALEREFWGDVQRDLPVKNTAVYLANQRLESLISQDGKKAHRTIISHPLTGQYVPHQDIDFEEKRSSKQTLEVDTYRYAASDIDVVEQSQTKEDLVQQSLGSIREGLNNIIEQEFLSEIVDAHHVISGGPHAVSYSDVLGYLEEAEGKLGAYDAPLQTSMRSLVLGPRTVATLRRAKSERKTGLGDSTLENGVVGPWQGWKVVQNNNLPFSADLNLATNPTDGDTITIAGVTFTFKDTTASAGDVKIGVAVGDTAANLVNAIEKNDGNYEEIDIRDNYMLRRKRGVSASYDSGTDTVEFTGHGDISTASDLTDGTDGWANQEQQAVFMIRGAIDMVVQFMRLEVSRKIKGFADYPKGLIGVGTEVFSDGEIMMVRFPIDASGF